MSGDPDQRCARVRWPGLHQRIAPASYRGFFVRDDPLRYLAIKLLERTPAGLVQRARGATRGLARRGRRRTPTVDS